MLLQNWGSRGQIWQSSTINWSLIPLTGLIYLYGDPILSIHWYSYNVETWLVSFFGQTSQKNPQMCSRMGVAGWENSEIGQEIGL